MTIVGEYVTVADAAKLLDVNSMTVYRRIWNGDLPAVKFGALIRIRMDDLLKLLEPHEWTPNRSTPSARRTARQAAATG